MKFRFICCTAMLLFLFSGSVAYSQSSYTSVSGQLFKGVPEACFRILGPPELSYHNEKIASQDSNLNARQRAIAFKDEITSQIQGMLKRFRIPITECTADTIRSMANIHMFVGFVKSKKDGYSHAEVRTSFYDFAKSIHTGKISKIGLFNSRSSSKALPDNKVVGYAFDEIRHQLYKLASEFRKQNAD